MSNRPIVIIGGMGPQASLALHDRVLRASRRHHSGNPDEYPEIIHLSLRIPEFFSGAASEGEAVRLIQSSLSRFDLPPQSLVCLPCNTAHKLVDRIGIPGNQFVSMIDAVVMELKRNKGRRIGLLASPNTIQSGLYHKALKANGFEVVQPNTKDMDSINKLIAVVIDGTSDQRSRLELTGIADRLVDKGADTILLGCTELPIIGVDAAVPVVDSLEALSHELIRRLNEPSKVPDILRS